VGDGLSRDKMRPMRGAPHPKREARCGAAGREDRDVRHQDRKHAFRGRVSRGGRRQSWLASCIRVGGDSGEVYVLANSGPLVEGKLVGHLHGLGTWQRR
jgi:hypothetical protein